MSRHFKIKDTEITAGGPELLVGGVFKNDVKELDNYFELVQELENVPYSKFAVTDKGTRVDAKALALVLSKGGTYYNAFKDLKVVVDSSSIYVELEGINKFYFNNEKVNYPMDFDTKKHFMGYIRSGLIEIVEPIFKCWDFNEKNGYIRKVVNFDTKETVAWQVKDNNTGIKIRANEDYAVLTRNGITEEIFTINGNIPEYSLRPFGDVFKYENTESLLEFSGMESKENYNFYLKRNEKTLLELENGKVKKQEEEISAGKTYELLNKASEILRNEVLALDFQNGKKKIEAILNDIEKEKEMLGFDAKLPENFDEKVRILEKADF
jgi:hypothetical protein